MKYIFGLTIVGYDLRYLLYFSTMYFLNQVSMAFGVPGFLNCFCLHVGMFACVCVCPPPRELITSDMKHMRNNQIKKFYGFSLFLYMTLAINKLNDRGLSKNVHHECLPKKTKIMRYYLQNH